MKISCHALIKNEENFIWFAINSVIDHVDEILIWDTGSTDSTVENIKTIKNPKVKFREIGEVNPAQLVNARLKMLQETKADWIFILDGDEIWHKDQIESQIEKIRNEGNKFDVIVNSNKMLIGDMYHYLPGNAGRYRIHDRVGHYNIRFVKNLHGLALQGVYPNEAYVLNGLKVQEFPRERILFSNNYYLHASFLLRSSKDNRKVKYEIGCEFPLDYFYPEVFFKKRPGIVPSPWKVMTSEYKLRAILETPVKKTRRRIFI